MTVRSFFTAPPTLIYSTPSEKVLKHQEEHLHLFAAIGEQIMDYEIGATIDSKFAGSNNIAKLRDHRFASHPNVHRYYYDSLSKEGTLLVYCVLSTKLIPKTQALILSDGNFADKNSIMTIKEQYEPALREAIFALRGNRLDRVSASTLSKAKKSFVYQQTGLVARTTDLEKFKIACTPNSAATLTNYSIRQWLSNNFRDYANTNPEEVAEVASRGNSLREYLTLSSRDRMEEGVHGTVIPLSDPTVEFFGFDILDHDGFAESVQTHSPENQIQLHIGNNSFRFGPARASANTRTITVIDGVSITYNTTFAAPLTRSLRSDNNSGQRMPYSTDVLQYKAGFKMTPDEEKYHKNTKTKPIFMGLELEMCTRTPSHDEVSSLISTIANSPFGDTCLIKADSSTGSYGFEIVTIPGTLAYLKQMITDHLLTPEICKRMMPSTSCGIHIHIGKEAFTKLSFGKFISFINSKKNSAFVREMAGRQENHYCQAWDIPRILGKGGKKSDNSCAVAAHVLRSMGVDHKIKDDSWQNRSTGNFTRGAVHVGKKATIEVRIFKSSQQLVNVLRKLEFVHSLVKFSNSGVSIQNIDVEHYIKFVMDKQNSSEYPNLINWLGSHDYLDKKEKVIPSTKKKSVSFSLKSSK